MYIRETKSSFVVFIRGWEKKRERERGCWSVDRLECHNWNGRVRLPQDNGLVRVQIINAALSLYLVLFVSPLHRRSLIPSTFLLRHFLRGSCLRGGNLVRWPTCSAAGKWRRIRRFWMVKGVSWGRVQFPWVRFSSSPFFFFNCSWSSWNFRVEILNLRLLSPSFKASARFFDSWVRFMVRGWICFEIFQKNLLRNPI